MEKETFISGYCRMTDCSRTVTVETDSAGFTDISCNYDNCVHAFVCTVAEKIRLYLSNL